MKNLKDEQTKTSVLLHKEVKGEPMLLEGFKRTSEGKSKTCDGVLGPS